MTFKIQENKLFRKENSDFIEANQKIQRLLRAYMENTPKKAFSKNQIAGADIRIGHIKGKLVKRLVIHLRSHGCGWKKRSGGCTMCGFWIETSQSKDQISTEEFIEQFKGVLRNYDMAQFPILCIYNAGSVLNEEEVPFHALEKIFNLISKMPTIERVVLESRIDYVDFEKVKSLKRVLKEKEFIIASGLESSNDIIRELCIHKGLPTKRFERYIEEANSLGIKTRIYLLIKPPFLTESEAIEDAVSSTRYLYDLDVRDVHFETMTIEEYTLVHSLYSLGYYRLPRLWSIIEILREVSPFIKPYISPFRYITDAKDIPHNCPLCSERVTRALLVDYCSDFNISHLVNLDCVCKKEWEKVIKEEDIQPLEKRVLYYLNNISSNRKRAGHEI